MSSRTESKRLWLAGGAAVAVLIVAVGWLFVVSPQLSAAAAIREQVESVELQNTLLQARNTKLKAQNDDVAELRAGLAAAVAELPFDSGLPQFTRQVAAQATANSILLSSVVVAGAAPVQAAAAVSPDATTTADAAAATGLVSIPVSLVATGARSNQLAFLSALQVDGPRRALVTSVQLAPAAELEADPSLDSAAVETAEAQFTMTLQLTIFSAPLDPAAQEALEKLLSGD